MANPDRSIWEGIHERNWLYWDAVKLSSDEAAIDYYLFFSVKKVKGRAFEWGVEMIVESAYAPDPLRKPKYVGKGKVAGLLLATVEDRPFHTQRKA